MVRNEQVRYFRWCDCFHRFAHPFTFLLSMLTALFDSYRQASKFLQYTLKSFLQDCKGMRQCPEERNSLIYDVMFSEYHKRNPGRPAVAAHPYQPTTGHSGKRPDAGYTSGYSDKGQATGYHSGYSGKESTAGYHSGYSDKGQAAVQHPRGADHARRYPGNGVPSSAEDKVSQQMGRLKTTDTVGDVLSSRRKYPRKIPC